MKDKIFLDTNVWVYNYSEGEKAITAQQLIHDNFDQIVLSTQILSELYNVLSIKLKVKTKEAGKNILFPFRPENGRFKSGHDLKSYPDYAPS